jgi:ubiquinone/menaquinone biosynthesis C-methylase UbiE
MTLEELQSHWNAFGKQDPFWAILSSASRQGNKWDVDEFFATGRTEIEGLRRSIADLGIEVRPQRALDFGCGAGRLSQALALHFAEVCGVDIAPSMIALAEQHNRHGARCRYYLNGAADLSLFGDNYFDLIYSNITLQHIEPRYTRKYLQEFLRVLAPGGLLVFQLPSEAVGRNRARQVLKRIIPASLAAVYRRLRAGNQPAMQMHGIPQAEVVRLLEAHQGQVIHMRPDTMAGKEWLAFQYYVRKQ